MLPCLVQPDLITTSWLVCVTSPFSLGVSVPRVNLPFLLWDSASLVLAASPDTFSYAYIPVIFNLTGCLTAGPDTSGVAVLAAGCPCAGAVFVTVSGQFLFPPLSVVIGTFTTTNVTLLDPANFTSVGFWLPPGSGVQLPVLLKSGSIATNTLASAVSYALPVVTGLSGCDTAALSSIVTNCRRAGGDDITIQGSNFGPGRASVLVASTQCVVSVWSDAKLVCRLPPMPVTHPLANQVIVIQAAGGGLTAAELSVAAVSYVPCPPGQVEAGRLCADCSAGTFSALAASTACTSCGVGTYASHGGMSICLPCEAGLYSSALGATACSSCRAGSAAASAVGAVACVACATGSFVAWDNATACLACPAGTVAQYTGLSACANCTVGSFAALPGSSLCATCPPGSVALTAGGSACTPCSPGTFAAVGLTTIQMEAGTFFSHTIVFSVKNGSG